MERKKKLAFVANCCIVGGVETALISLLNQIDTQKYDITLFTNFCGNPVVHSIPPQIKCIDLDAYNIKTVYTAARKSRNYGRALAILWNYARFRLARDKYLKTPLLYQHIKFDESKFDCVIAYKYGISTVFIAKNALNASKTILWLHGVLPSQDKQYLQLLCSFDQCFCVSEFVRTHFLQRCSTMAEKTAVIHNALSADEILQKSEPLPCDTDFSKAWLLTTVGRLGQDTCQIVIPKTARMLTDSGLDFVWYLIGDGPERTAIEQEIKRCGVEDKVFLLGTKSNPYPYIRTCTIYVQTSTSEGWCLTTQEARILHKPCVVTDIPVMHEQFVDGENGIIADGTDAAALYRGILRLIRSDALRVHITETLSATPQDTANELAKLYDFIEG